MYEYFKFFHFFFVIFIVDDSCANYNSCETGLSFLIYDDNMLALELHIIQVLVLKKCSISKYERNVILLSFKFQKIKTK